MTELKSINPANGKILGSVEVSSGKEILDKISAAHKSQKDWAELGVKGRKKLLKNVIKNFFKQKEEVAELTSSEMGMPITLSRADVDDSMRYFDWYLNSAESYLAPEVIFEDRGIRHTIYREPIGVSANITPWNFPTSNFVWSVAQSLICGNTVVYKASEEVPLSGKLIGQIMNQSGLPKGVFSEVYGDASVGRILVGGDIDMVCFTGSTATGKYLYKVAAEKFIKSFLELGGSAPGIIFEDADLDRVVDSIFGNRFLYCGQVCDGLKRLIVHKSILEKVIKVLVGKINMVRIGDPLDAKTEIGPLVSSKQLSILEEQVADAIKKGARVEIGAKKLDIDGGFFYQPTIFTGVDRDMRIWKEEVFGPVLPIVTFRTDEEALRLANDTKYGLGGYVFTEDKKRANKIALQLKTGMIQINNAGYLQPCSPFGGYKESGIGREHGKFGFYDLTQVKIVATEK